MNSIAQLRSTESQLEGTKRNIRREELVDAELAKVATGTKTYESCGRAYALTFFSLFNLTISLSKNLLFNLRSFCRFILRPLPEIREDLQQRVAKNKEKATTLEVFICSFLCLISLISYIFF